MKKKLVSIVLAVTMVCSLAACGNSGNTSTDAATEAAEQQETETAAPDTVSDEKADTEAADTEETAKNETSAEAFTIGYPAVAATNTTMEAMKLNRTTVAEAAGGSLITEDWDFSPEGTVQSVEKLIERGCKGIIITPTDQSILPTITNMCEEAEVYWAISMRSIEDEAIKEIVYASEYYVGYITQDGYTLGYDMGKVVADNGGKTYALISGSVGDTDSEIREAGLDKAAEEFGLECLSEVRSLSSPADTTAAIESILASYPDIDAIVRVTSSTSGEGVAIAETLSGAGKSGEIIYASFNTEDGMEVYIEDGTVTQAFISLNEFDSLAVATILVNQIIGTPMSEEKIEVNLEFASISDVEELNAYNKYYSTTESPLYSADEIQELMLGKSFDEFKQNVIDTFSIQQVIERKSAQ